MTIKELFANFKKCKHRLKNKKKIDEIFKETVAKSIGDAIVGKLQDYDYIVICPDDTDYVCIQLAKKGIVGLKRWTQEYYLLYINKSCNKLQVYYKDGKKGQVVKEISDDVETSEILRYLTKGGTP